MIICNRYAKIQTGLTQHRLLRLVVINPTLNVELMTLVKLVSMCGTYDFSEVSVDGY